MLLPLRDQLTEPQTDGHPDNNASANCVPASLSSGISYLIGRDVYGGDLKDAVYGPNYTGATDPAHFIDYLLAQYGIKMWEVRGSGDQLVATIKAELANGHPVTGAIPSQWGITT